MILCKTRVRLPPPPPEVDLIGNRGVREGAAVSLRSGARWGRAELVRDGEGMHTQRIAIRRSIRPSRCSNPLIRGDAVTIRATGAVIALMLGASTALAQGKVPPPPPPSSLQQKTATSAPPPSPPLIVHPMSLGVRFRDQSITFTLSQMSIDPLEFGGITSPLQTKVRFSGNEGDARVHIQMSGVPVRAHGEWARKSRSTRDSRARSPSRKHSRT